jgi:predicted Ser/Thr protein kinase
VSDESAGQKPVRQVRLEQILADYLHSLEKDEPLDREALIAAHPDLADDLRSFFRNHHSIVNLAVPLHAAAEAPTLIGPSEAGPARAANAVRYFGDYELLTEIARGGMGVVYKARQVNLNRPVALKMILAGQLANDSDVKRFYAEAEAAAKLDHPGIVPIFEIGQHDGQHYFSMAFVEGESLAKRVANVPLPPREAAEMVRKVAEAVDYAHRKGIIHRDLKPGNVLLDQTGQPRVTDFGLAKQIQGDSGLTGTGQILGTPSYMPPEQAAGKIDEIGPAADVYSLGAILYCLLTGRPPFQAANPMDTLLQVLDQEPVAPRQLNTSTPLDLNTIALKCLEKDASRRYDSAQDVADELQRFLSGAPIVARPINVLERGWRWCKRKPLIPSICAVLIVVATIAGLLFRYSAAVAANRRALRDVANASVGPMAPFVLADWEYPKAKSKASMQGGSASAAKAGTAPPAVAIAPELYAYSTPDSLESVWSHYSILAGIDRKFETGRVSSRTSWGAATSGAGASAAIGAVLVHTGDPSRPSVQSATLVVQRPPYTVTVFITRSKDEDQTHISMVVEKKPAQPSL